MIYRCTTPCTWNGRYWKEGDLTGLLPEHLEPPEYFKPVTDSGSIQEVIDTIDEEEQPETFAELSQQLLDVGNTGVGICSGDDLQLKNYQQLKKIAKENGVFDESMKTKEMLIEAIEATQEKEIG